MMKFVSIFKRRIVYLLLALMIGVTSIADTTKVLAIPDEQFYSSNDILYFDPDACGLSDDAPAAPPGGAVGDIAGNDVAEKLFRFLTSTNFASFGNKPFNAIQAAGALGNFQQESGMNPAAVEGNGEGHGLAQWSFSRKTTLYSLAASMGKQWSDLEVQLTMIRNELNNPYGGSLLRGGFEGVSTPKDASFIFQKIYEAAGIPNQAKRDQAAAQYYEKYKNLAPGPAPSTTGGDNAGAAADCKPGGGGASTGADNFVVYNQLDPKWSKNKFGPTTMGESGCGPAAMAMIITALTGKSVTPPETAAYTESKGLVGPNGGSSWEIGPVLAEHWGLKSQKLSKTVVAINDALKAGSMLIVPGRGAAPFTSAGHFIVIRGLDSDGKWKIGDSNGEEGAKNSQRSWDPKEILDKVDDSIIAISK